MKSNTIIVIVLTVVLAGGVYWYTTAQSGNQAPLSASANASNPAQVQFQTLVSQLETISFKTDVFSDPRFTGLVNITVPITAEPSGRLDPFAPVQGAAGL